MPRRYNAQRRHIIQALDALLYQLFCFSFYLSPSLFNMFLRLAAQLVCTITREFSPTLSLGSFFLLPLLSNSFSIWNHAITGPAEGRAVILDFVGLAYSPSKFQLLFVDITILFLQLLLATISFEMHTPESSNDSDHLLPPTSPMPPPLAFGQKALESNNELQYIVDIRLSSILARLRNTPAMARGSSSQDTLIPFPNTTMLPIPRSLLLRTTRRRDRRDAEQETRTVPGAINSEEMD